MGADRARRRTELEMLDGTGTMRKVEAAGAGHEAVGAGPESESGPVVEGEASDGSVWEDWREGDWIAGTGVSLVGAAAEVGLGDEFEVEPAADESWWEVVDSSKMEGAGRAAELNMALQVFATTVEVDGTLGDGQLAMQLCDLGGQKG